LRDRQSDQLYVEPFVGGCNVIDKVNGPRWGNDLNQSLIAMWRAVQRGWVPPSVITEDDYRRIREDLLGDPALRAFTAFAASWGGKWWAGYARGNTAKGTPRNYVDETRRAILKQSTSMMSVRLTSMPYQEMPIPAGSIVYCDPPYAGTTSYKAASGWDAAAFWTWAKKLATEGGCDVFVSEFAAPSDWACVLEFSRNNALNSSPVTERLFTFRS
jgi:DNA adenine methylase